MMGVGARWAAFIAVWLLLACGLPAHADTALSLYQSFRGNYNFTGTTETLRTKNNNYPCTMVSNSTGVYATLSGVPSGAKIESAQLYWAGSGTSYDYTVNFDGVQVTAPTSRQYVSKYTTNNTTYTYFSGAADVTAQVAKKGNGSYSFSGLTVSIGDPWCAVQGVVGGFALVVVYSHPNEVFRMLNVYEGFQAFRNTSLTINLSGFNVPNPLPSTTTGRIGHVTWEGDSTLSQGGEDLLFNGYAMTDSMNPSGNQFNSASNVTGDSTTYGIDFDIYTVKDPVIQAGQTTATTTYRSGQDLVLLSTEIAAIPYSATSDLTLTMTRDSVLRVGATTNYTISVSNIGTDADVGPITVVDTLPAGLKLVSTSGSGWTCSNAAGSSGQTIVTCTQNGPLAPNTKMTPLTVAVTPGSNTSYTNTATVSGKTFEKNTANNTTSETTTAADNDVGTGFVLTSESCTPGQLIVTSPGDAGCHKFIGPVTAASSDINVYMTYVTGTPQKATEMTSVKGTLSVDLMATCLPYANNVSVTYVGLSLDCKGTWKNYRIIVIPGQSTVPSPPDLFFPDVGRVSLQIKSGTVTGVVNFISRPQDVRLRDVLRSSDNYSDQLGLASNSPNWTKNDSFAFARSGEPFLLRMGARMADGNWAPSFGKEPAALSGILPADALDLDLRLDLFAAEPSSTAPARQVVDASGVIDRVVAEAFVFDQTWTQSATVTGALDATVRWYEAGYLGITPYLIDYLGTGPVGNVPNPQNPGAIARLSNSTRVVGRFYPDHFVTELTENFACLPGMNCPAASTDPAAPSYPVSGATYSLQPFSYIIKPYGLTRNGTPAMLSLFRHLSARPIQLSMVKQPNVTTVPAGGPFTIDPAYTLPYSSSATDFPDLKGKGNYKLGNAYSASAKAAMTAPTPVYLRASMTDAIQTAGPVQKSVTINSVATAPAQWEDGLMVVAGRLQVGNVYGSELLRLPVPLTVQYWNGNSWLTNTADSDSMVAPNLTAAKCTGTFASSAAGGCKTGVLTMVGAGTAARVKEGRGSVVLQSPGRGNSGSINFSADTTSAAWLPSTLARATFGLFKSPIIYIREVY